MRQHRFLPQIARELHSLRVRLLASFALVVVLALVMAGAIFVTLQHGESNHATLDRLAAAAPEISLELRVLHTHGATPQQVSDYVHQVSRDRQVRVLIVDRRDGTVIEDSATSGSLRNKRLTFPSGSAAPTTYHSIYESWHGVDPGTRNLILLTPAYGRVGQPFARKNEPDASELGTNQIVVLAVPEATIANAWLGLLPGLAWAGLAAILLSAGMAVLLARSIAKPILALTRASEEVAKGNFDQQVAQTDPDEIGRLAAAFNSMAREMGHSYLQTRTLIADISHDLKTPLTSILGFAQALRDGTAQDRESIQELSGIICEEAEHIYTIVDGLLYLSEIKAGEVALNRVPVNLADLAGRCLRRIEPALRERQIEVEVRLAPDIEVTGDDDKLQRILSNLLDNACKYTPDGAQIAVSAELLSGDPHLAHLSVQNSGSYIPPEEQAKLFDRFYRMDRSRSSSTRGSGLGLAIVKELVDLHEGAIQVTSDPQQGTTFHLYLPASGAGRPAALHGNPLPAKPAWQRAQPHIP